MSRILIIEDELPLRLALQDCLAAEGYRVILASEGESGLERALKEKPDLILLDLMMPRLDGLALCRELRARGRNVPILMLTAKGMVQDKVHGFEAGADDYLVKPFSTEELLARVRALLRRVEKRSATPGQVRLGRLRIDFIRQEAWEGRRSVHLTPKEFSMLRLLLENPGEVISRERFLDVVWGYGAFPTTRTVDNHVASLRQKLEPDPQSPVCLQTVHGTGYRVAPEVCKSMTNGNGAAG